MTTVFKCPSVSIVRLFFLLFTQRDIVQLVNFRQTESKSEIFRLHNKQKVLNQYLDLDQDFWNFLEQSFSRSST